MVVVFCKVNSSFPNGGKKKFKTAIVNSLNNNELQNKSLGVVVIGRIWGYICFELIESICGVFAFL